MPQGFSETDKRMADAATLALQKRPGSLSPEDVCAVLLASSHDGAWLLVEIDLRQGGAHMYLKRHILSILTTIKNNLGKRFEGDSAMMDVLRRDFPER